MIQPIYLHDFINHLFGICAIHFIFLCDFPQGYAFLYLHTFIVSFCLNAFFSAHCKGSQAQDQSHCHQYECVFSDFSGFSDYSSLCSSFHDLAPFLLEHFFVLHLYNNRTHILCHHFLQKIANIGLILFEHRGIMKANIEQEWNNWQDMTFFCHKLDKCRPFGYNDKE